MSEGPVNRPRTDLARQALEAYLGRGKRGAEIWEAAKLSGDALDHILDLITDLAHFASEDLGVDLFAPPRLATVEEWFRRETFEAAFEATHIESAGGDPPA